MKEEVRKRIATEAGLSFSRELIRQSKIPFTGATSELARDIECVDPRVWEAICYAAADKTLSDKDILIRAENQETPKIYKSTKVTDYNYGYYDGEWKMCSDMLKAGFVKVEPKEFPKES